MIPQGTIVGAAKQGGGGVGSLNGLAGTVDLTSPDGSISITTSGQDIQLETSGGGGSQTPWLQDIDGGFYDLTDVNVIQATQILVNGGTGTGVTLEVGGTMSFEYLYAASFGTVVDNNGNASFAGLSATSQSNLYGGIETNGSNIDLNSGSINNTNEIAWSSGGYLTGDGGGGTLFNGGLSIDSSNNINNVDNVYLSGTLQFNGGAFLEQGYLHLDGNIDAVSDISYSSGGFANDDSSGGINFPSSNISSSGVITGSKFVTAGGTSSQFVKGDGSLDSTVYGTGSVTSVATNSSLTGGPITTTGTLGLNLANANTWTGKQTFNTTAPTFGTMTLGSVLFAGTSGLLSQDNSNFFYDSTNHRLCLGTMTSIEALTLKGNLAFPASSGGGATYQIYTANSGVGAGDNLTLQSANGFTGGFAGGAININTGAGSASTSGSFGPGGGFYNVTLGNGGNASVASGSSHGGPGGTFVLLGGNGGSTTGGTSLNNGGAGGGIQFIGGTAGAPTSITGSTNNGGVGGPISITSGQGGANTSIAAGGGAGGTSVIASGAGGDAGAGKSGGGGGAFSFNGGGGGNSTQGSVSGNVGGFGATFAFNGGTGGNGITSGAVNVTSGAGGNLTMTAGTSGFVSGAGGTNTVGVAGAISLTGGSGGLFGGTGTAVGANGGNVNINGGVATSSTGSTAAGGSIYILPGAGGPSGVSGNIFFGVNSSGTLRGNIIIGATADDGSTNNLQAQSFSIVNKLLVNNSGNITKLNNVTTSFPSSQGAVNSVLTNNGSGTLTWSGTPGVVAYQRVTGQIAAASLTAYTVGASDASFQISANILITASTLNSFTATCTYTDESNISRTLTLNFSQLTGAFITTLTNATGAAPYEGVPLHIRCKAGTTITFATTGTFTTVTYNFEAAIRTIN